MAECDDMRARMKPSRWGSHTAAHAFVTSLIPLFNGLLYYGNDFNCNISEVRLFSSSCLDRKDQNIGVSAGLFDDQLLVLCNLMLQS